MKTLLELVQDAAGEMALNEPNVVIGTLATDVKQLLKFANALGQELLTDYEWQRLTKTHTFTLETDSQDGTTTSGSAVITGLTDTSSFDTTWEVSGTGIPTNTAIQSVDGATQITLTQNATASGTVTIAFTKTIYNLPDDFERPINRTQWDRSNHWEMVGPKSPQEWQWMKGGIVATGPRVRYRLLGNKFQVWPLQVSDSTLAFEYVSTNWVIADGDTDPSKSKFTVDTDTCVFKDRLIITGIKKKYFETKGFDATGFTRDYEVELGKSKGQDKGAPTLSLAPQRSNILISPANIPDGNVYGQ